jgi:PilZ domain
MVHPKVALWNRPFHPKASVGDRILRLNRRMATATDRVPDANSPPTSATPAEPLREVRVPLKLDVRVWGIDCWGKPFSRHARTLEISALGARLEDVGGVQKGDIIGIQYGEAKARFRIVWVGQPTSEQAGSVGVECVEPGKCIWAEVMQKSTPAADAPVFTPAVPPGIPPSASASLTGEWPERDRRRYPRVQCTGALRVKQVGTNFEATQKLTDISLGGCYGESLAPMPRDSIVDMVLEVCGEHINARGMVRTHHPSMGNGIGFTEVAPEEWKKIVKVIQQLGGGNMVFDAPQEPDVGDAIEALLSLLQKKGIHVTRDEFLQEMKQRMAVAHPSKSA